MYQKIVSTAPGGQPARPTRHYRWTGLLMAAIVTAASVVAFSHRPPPAFPATKVKLDHMLVNGIGQAGSRLVAAGELGHLMFSDDAGVTWQDARVTPQRGSTLTQVRFAGDKVGYAVGHNGWILRSADGGASWTEVQFNAERTEPLLDVLSKPDGALYAAGSFGSYVSSNNGGATLRRPDTGLGDAHLYGLANDESGRMLLVGEQGLVGRSDDGGASWTKLPPFYPGSFFGVVKLSADEWVVYGMRGNVFTSRDFGASWQRGKNTLTAALFGGTVTRSGRIVLVGQGGAIIVSDDRGASFDTVRAGGVASLSSVLAVAGDTILVAGDSGIEQLELPPLHTPH